jgi:phosphonoacetaldehyde hydrolase
MGLERDDFAALAPEERRLRLARAEAELRQAGADFVIEDVSHLMPVVHEIARRIGA